MKELRESASRPASRASSGSGLSGSTGMAAAATALAASSGGGGVRPSGGSVTSGKGA